MPGAGFFFVGRGAPEPALRNAGGLLQKPEKEDRSADSFPVSYGSACKLVCMRLRGCCL
jgi:hypothetical protein